MVHRICAMQWNERTRTKYTHTLTQMISWTILVFLPFLQTIYRYCALVKLLRSLNGRLRAGPIASRRIVFPLNFRHFFPFVVVADVVDGSASGILVFVRIPADENSQQRLQNAPRYLPNKIEVGHDKSTHTQTVCSWHIGTWHGKACFVRHECSSFYTTSDDCMRPD